MVFVRLFRPWRCFCPSAAPGLLVLACWFGAEVTQAADVPVSRPHCGVVIDAALRHSAATALFEASMLQNERIVPVERVEIDKVLQEEQLQAMFTADAIGRRSAFGQKVKADLLVMVRDATPHTQEVGNRSSKLKAGGGAKSRIDLIVCETRHGLRLAVATVVVSGDSETEAASLRSAFDNGLARYRQNIRQIIAVPPFVSQDLTHEFDFLEDVYPQLIEEMLLQRPGVLIVEISEAKALADELALTHSADIRRQLPIYLNGQYRHDGIGSALRVTINVECRQGDRKLGSFAIPGAQPSKAAAPLTAGSDKLIQSASDAAGKPAPAKIDETVEAHGLAARAKIFDRYGDWRQARVLAEASLLLDAHQPEMHAVAFRALNELAEGSSGHWGLIRPQGVTAALEYFRQSLPHLEAYLGETTIEIRRSDGTPEFDIDKYWETVRAEVARREAPLGQWHEANREALGVVWNVLHRKSEAQIDDETAELCFKLLTEEPFRQMAAPGEVCQDDAAVRSAFEMRLGLLKEFAYRKNPQRLCGVVFRRDVVELNDPRWVQFLHNAQAIPNPNIAQYASLILDNDLKVAGRLGQRPADHIVSNPKLSVPPPTYVADAEVRFEPVNFKKVQIARQIPHISNRIIGCMRAGPGVDIFWTSYLIFTMKQEGVLDYTIGCVPPRPKEDADPNPDDPCWLWLTRDSGCFDGRLAWFFIDLSPVRYQSPNDEWDKSHERNVVVETALIAFDLEKDHTYWLGKSEGLPPNASAIAPIAPGKVCVAGWFGRTWCAIASLDADSAPARQPVKVIYEARDVIPDIYPPDNGISIAYPIDYLRTLAPPAGGVVPRADRGLLPRVLARRRGGPGFLMIDPNKYTVEKFPDPLLQTRNTDVFGNQIYFRGTGPGSKLEMRRSGIADPTPTDVSWEVPDAQFIIDQGVAHFMDALHHQWFVSRDGSPPFRLLHGDVPGDVFTAGTLTITNHYGMTLLGHGDKHDLVRVEFPSPLPEAAR